MFIPDAAMISGFIARGQSAFFAASGMNMTGKRNPARKSDQAENLKRIPRNVRTGFDQTRFIHPRPSSVLPARREIAGGILNEQHVFQSVLLQPCGDSFGFVFEGKQKLARLESGFSGGTEALDGHLIEQQGKIVGGEIRRGWAGLFAMTFLRGGKCASYRAGAYVSHRFLFNSESMAAFVRCRYTVRLIEFPFLLPLVESRDII